MPWMAAIPAITSAAGTAMTMFGGGDDGGPKQAFFPSRTTNKQLTDLLQLVGKSKGLKKLGLDPEKTRGEVLADTDSRMADLFSKSGLDRTRNQLFGYDGDNNGLFAFLNQMQDPSNDLINQDIANRGQSLSQFRNQDPALQGLFNQLGDELDSGGALDPGSLREVQQATRAAQQARGMGFGNSDVFEEAMNVGREAEARRRRTQAFGLNLLGNPADFAANQAAATPASGFQTSLGLFGMGRQGANAGPGFIKDPFGPNGIAQTQPNNPVAAAGAGLMGIGGNLLGAQLGNMGAGGGSQGGDPFSAFQVPASSGAPSGTYDFGFGTNSYFGG